MKYLVVRDEEDKEHGIIFPDAVVHKVVARLHRASDVRVISAGFCEWLGLSERWNVWGESESLRGMKSRPEDAEILLRSFPRQVMT